MSDNPFVWVMDETMDAASAVLFAGLILLTGFGLLLVVASRWLGGPEYPAERLFLGGSGFSVLSFAGFIVLRKIGLRNQVVRLVAKRLAIICAISTVVAGFSGMAWIVLRILP